MTNDEKIKIIESSKSKTDAKNKLGFHSNGVGSKKLLNLCVELGISVNYWDVIKEKKFSNCLLCGNKIEHYKKFCNNSCSAKHNNSLRTGVSEEQKLKVSETLKNKYKNGELSNANKGKKLYYRKGGYKGYPIKKEFTDKNCCVCGVEFRAKGYPSKARKTCSNECKVNKTTGRKYLNGSRKNIEYFNKWVNESVNLESSWELRVAERLDELNIEWVRPKYLKWMDSTNTERLYYPDFYLPKYSLYLDPKNEYCLVKDKEKMEYFENTINIKYGHIKSVLIEINKLKYENEV
jgi:predicted nucleic acid-binding Zn ribbon protein